jgi:transcriptional regulator with AAA-type ATPase domain
MIGHPDRIEPFKSFLQVIARNPEPVLISGPPGSGKKKTAQLLIEHSPLKERPVITLEALQFDGDLKEQVLSKIKGAGSLVLMDLEHLPLAQQSKFSTWLKQETAAAKVRVLATTTCSEGIYGDLRFEFPYFIQLPSLNEVREDIPYHLKYFLREKPIHYLRYFFLLKAFYHQWEGNIRELEHFIFQAMAYYQSLALPQQAGGGKEIFGEQKIRYYQDVLKGEWWYYPFRFRPEFTTHFREILTKTDYRKQIIEKGWVIPLIKEEPGLLVLDLREPDFEAKALQVYYLFDHYLKEREGKSL